MHSPTTDELFRSLFREIRELQLSPANEHPTLQQHLSNISKLSRTLEIKLFQQEMTQQCQH